LSLKKMFEHRQILKNDLKEVKDPWKKLIIQGKLAYYFFQRPIADFFLKKILKKRLKTDEVFKKIDRFLLNQGGTFKTYLYGTCEKFFPIKGSSILVPGIGYGKNLFQLAAFRPKTIVAFDLYEYQKEWDFLKEKIKKEFGSEVVFYKGSFESLPKELENSFDFIISDAVLEHVRDMPAFIKKSKKFLKKGGIFYASFGPIWYGPRGDHLVWGEEKMFDHVTLSEKEYWENFDKKFSVTGVDSTEPKFMVENKLFSYLRAEEYLEFFSQEGFEKIIFSAKISTRALSLFKKKPELHKLLDENNVPAFDRFCAGLYLLMKNERQ